MNDQDLMQIIQRLSNKKHLVHNQVHYQTFHWDGAEPHDAKWG